MSLADDSRTDSGRSAGADAAEATSENFAASRSRVDSGTGFELHSHQEDQLAWMSSGSMELAVEGERWHLRREHFAWIPGGMLHEMTFEEPGELVSVYADPGLRPPGQWDRPRTVQADELAAALLLHLVDGSPSPLRRSRCRLLLADLLAEAPAHHDAVALPRDPRARAIAARLLEQPDDPRPLADWAGAHGVSTKTIARAFLADTGSTFREWRVRARLHAAAGMLARGQAVQTVARAVGYESVSSFIAAFKLRFGTTPAHYAAAARPARPA